MKGILVRAGIDHSYGQWNAPVDPESRRFVYVPIPENQKSHPGLERPYSELMPELNVFCSNQGCDLKHDLKFPSDLLKGNMHLDPDFQNLTYGDWGDRRGKEIAQLNEGDFLAFYAGLRPIKKCEHKLIYALIGFYIVEDVVPIYDVPRERWDENAHTRRFNHNKAEIIVRAKKDLSGRLEKCIPIGEWRDRAYRVRRDLLNAWGDLSVNDGYIQRSAVPPSFLNAKRFYKWFLKQKVVLVEKNN
jgi:hypothetical protein